MDVEVSVDIQEIKNCRITDETPIFYEPCPDCGAMLGCYLDTLSYPKVGEKYEYVLWCALCEKDWHGLMTLKSVGKIKLSTSNLIGY